MLNIPFGLEQSITIDRSIEDVYGHVSDFTTWPQWSPWLCQEPDCPVTVTGDAGTTGHKQAWNGDFIGAGEMVLAAARANESLDYDLAFLRPWKTRSKVGFRFQPAGERTQVTWWMRGTLPFFLFFMTKKMVGWVGSDYRRGLSMLKEQLETGEVLSEVTVQGKVARPQAYYLGKRRACAVADVGTTMHQDLQAMFDLVQAGKVPQPEKVFSITHKFDMVTQHYEYTTGFLYESRQGAVDGIEQGELPAHTALQVRHKGAYRHLGNAWSAAMGCARSRHKLDKSVPAYEIYVNNPQDAAERDLEVEIYAPVK